VDNYNKSSKDEKEKKDSGVVICWVKITITDTAKIE